MGRRLSDDLCLHAEGHATHLILSRSSRYAKGSHKLYRIISSEQQVHTSLESILRMRSGLVTIHTVQRLRFRNFDASLFAATRYRQTRKEFGMNCVPPRQKGQATNGLDIVQTNSA